MLEAGAGDILDAEVEALVNPVNTVGVMGRGLALAFKRAFPGNFRAYAKACRRGELTLGRVLPFREKGRLVINFPTKRHWREASTLADVEAGLVALVDCVRRERLESLAVPALGCGLGGLAWPEVRALIEHAFAPLPEVRVVLFGPR